MAQMPARLQAFFDTHQAKTADMKRRGHDQLSIVMQAVDEISAHMNDLQSQLTQAELEAHDHALDGKYQWMHTRLDAAILRGGNVRREIRDWARVLVEVEESFNQDVIDVNAVLAIRGKDGTMAKPHPPLVQNAAPVVE